MNKYLIKEKVLLLQNVSLEDWGYIKIIIDEMFYKKQKELGKNLKLSADETAVDVVLRSRFG